MRISDFDDEELVFMNMVNNHSSEINNNALNNSLDKREVPYNQKKKKNTGKWRTAVVAVTIVAMAICGKIGYDMDKKQANDNNIGISYDRSNQQEIDSKIEEYTKLMDIDGPEETKIKIITGRNDDNPSDPFVDFYAGVLVDNLVNASRLEDPWLEVMCVSVAARDIINEPCRKEQFDKVFSGLRRREEFRNNAENDRLGKFNFDDSVDFWQMLGYENEEEFDKNAKNDIDYVYTIIKGMESKNGKRM